MKGLTITWVQILLRNQYPIKIFDEQNVNWRICMKIFLFLWLETLCSIPFHHLDLYHDIQLWISVVVCFVLVLCFIFYFSFLSFLSFSILFMCTFSFFPYYYLLFFHDSLLFLLVWCHKLCLLLFLFDHNHVFHHDDLSV